MRRTLKQRGRGFTLIEALVALVVLSTGLLGIAALLLGCLRDHHQALQRLTAIGLVRDMADRIRANPLAGNLYDSTHAAADAGVCDESAGCSSAQQAAADLAFFAASAAAQFPQAGIHIALEPAIGPATANRYLITLHWQDPRSADGASGVSLRLLAQRPVAG